MGQMGLASRTANDRTVNALVRNSNGAGHPTGERTTLVLALRSGRCPSVRPKALAPSVALGSNAKINVPFADVVQRLTRSRSLVFAHGSCLLAR
jgi:hypothetical protein